MCEIELHPGDERDGLGDSGIIMTLDIGRRPSRSQSYDSHDLRLRKDSSLFVSFNFYLLLV